MEAISTGGHEKTAGAQAAAGQMKHQSYGLVGTVILSAPFMMAKAGRVAAAPPDLQGVYQSIPDGVTLPGGLKNAGSPAAIELLPEAMQQAKSTDLKKDPWKMCQPVGPF